MLRLIEQFGGNQKKEKPEMQKWVDKLFREDGLQSPPKPKEEPNPDQLSLFSFFDEEPKQKPKQKPEVDLDELPYD